MGFFTIATCCDKLESTFLAVVRFVSVIILLDC